MKSNLIDVPLATTQPNAGLTPRELMLRSWINFETIAGLYYARHSFSAYAPVMLQFLSVLGFRHAGPVDETRMPFCSVEDRRGILLLVLEGLYRQAGGSYLTTTVFLLLYKRLTLESTSIADTHFRLKVMNVLPKVMTDHIRAAYPVTMVSVDAEVDEHRFNVLLHNLQESQGKSS